MSDNVVKSEDLNQEKAKPAKKTPAKKAAAPKKEAKPLDQKPNTVIIVFESGSSYRSNDLAFTRANPIQEVSEEIAAQLLQFDNFRIANQFEIEDFLNSRED